MSAGVEPTLQAIVVPGTPYSLMRILRPGTSKIEISLIDNFVTSTSLVKAKVDLGRRDGWMGIGRGEGRELSVYSAMLRGTLRHRGVRYVPAIQSCRRTLTMQCVQGAGNKIPGVLWFRCRNRVLLHLRLVPRRPTPTHGLLDRTSGTRRAFTRPIGFLTEAWI